VDDLSPAESKKNIEEILERWGQAEQSGRRQIAWENRSAATIELNHGTHGTHERNTEEDRGRRRGGNASPVGQRVPPVSELPRPTHRLGTVEPTVIPGTTLRPTADLKEAVDCRERTQRAHTESRRRITPITAWVRFENPRPPAGWLCSASFARVSEIPHRFGADQGFLAPA
jgi:hypothetical protein